MRGLALTLAIAVYAPAAVQAQAPPPTPTPLVQVAGLKSISAHVQVIPDNSVMLVPNVGFLVGAKAVLVVDTGLGPRNGAAVAAVARRIAPGRAIFLAATHAHPEHDLGASGFPPGTKLIRSANQAADKDADLALVPTFAARSPATAELLEGADFRPADITFTDTYRLDLGGVEAVLTALEPAHTDGDTAIWVEKDRVLFSGDLAMRDQPVVVTPHATLATWRRNLDFLERLQPAVVAPSHGPVGDAGFIRGYHAYLDEIAERAAAAKAGGADLEAATEAVWQAMRSRYPNRGRLAGAVRMVLAGQP